MGGIPAVYLYKFYAWVKARDENVPMRVIPPAAGKLKICIEIVFNARHSMNTYAFAFINKLLLIFGLFYLGLFGN